MTTQEVSAVVQAYAEGKTIQFQYRGIDSWVDVLPRDRFDLNFHSYDYRVKPEPPKPREFWIRFCGETLPKVNSAFKTLVAAQQAKGQCYADHIIHVREVLEETPVVKP